jgi:hypothetical protein
VSAETDRVVERIRKLLALSASTNPNEAALAADKAVELAQRHNLDLALIDGRPSDPYVERSCDVGAASQWRWLLMSAIARANFCRALRRRERGRLLASMFVIGEPHNIAVCEFLFQYLAREIERLASKGWQRAHMVYGEHVEARSWKNDFRRGAVATIDGRLRERSQLFAEGSARAEALVLTKDAALIEAVERFHPNVPTTTVRVRAGAAYQQGQWAAREIALQRAVASTSAGGQRMFGASRARYGNLP